MLNIFWSLLETCLDDLSGQRDPFDYVLGAVGGLIFTLSDKLKRGDPLLNVETFYTSLKLILATDHYHFTVTSLRGPAHNEHMKSMLRLIAMPADLPQLMDQDCISDTLQFSLSSIVFLECDANVIGKKIYILNKENL